MRPERGTIYINYADLSWPVEYLVTEDEVGPHRIEISGWIRFFPDIDRNDLLRRTGNPQATVYLKMGDGRWARLSLPETDGDGVTYTVGRTSHIIPPPDWAPK